MSAGDPLLIHRVGAVTELVLNRPDKANALNARLVEALLDAISHAATTDAKLLLLRGEGRHFCAGFDFSDLDHQSDGDLLHRFVRIEQLLQALHHAPLTTLALCHGSAFGAGADWLQPAIGALPRPQPGSGCRVCASESYSARAAWRR
jgi:enoyl-CoA hydratase